MLFAFFVLFHFIVGTVIYSSYLRPLFSGPKTVQASVTLLDSLPVFLEKTNSEELEQDILPMLYLAMESSMSQVKLKM